MYYLRCLIGTKSNYQVMCNLTGEILLDRGEVITRRKLKDLIRWANKETGKVYFDDPYFTQEYIIRE